MPVLKRFPDVHYFLGGTIDLASPVDPKQSPVAKPNLNELTISGARTSSFEAEVVSSSLDELEKRGFDMTLSFRYGAAHGGASLSKLSYSSSTANSMSAVLRGTVALGTLALPEETPFTQARPQRSACGSYLITSIDCGEEIQLVVTAQYSRVESGEKVEAALNAVVSFFRAGGSVDTQLSEEHRKTLSSCQLKAKLYVSDGNLTPFLANDLLKRLTGSTGASVEWNALDALAAAFNNWRGLIAADRNRWSVISASLEPIADFSDKLGPEWANQSDEWTTVSDGMRQALEYSMQLGQRLSSARDFINNRLSKYPYVLDATIAGYKQTLQDCGDYDEDLANLIVRTLKNSPDTTQSDMKHKLKAAFTGPDVDSALLDQRIAVVMQRILPEFVLPSAFLISSNWHQGNNWATLDFRIDGVDASKLQFRLVDRGPNEGDSGFTYKPENARFERQTTSFAAFQGQSTILATYNNVVLYRWLV